ncbi:interferon alpha/beta receptor 1a-like [Gouania willdenowi]|uniref:Interferon alpha/beta receptor 1a-like n=1 Tax=Gouania willdenowi TaxID=441366 RepID=A0A8C5EDU8_GOUWI|nr:interferon alpha/beta receptor 1a-like [Gouania willdenowi]
MYTSLCFHCLIGWVIWRTGGANLASPQKIDVITLNTNYILCWDWGDTEESVTATFTTQYLEKFKLQSKKSPNWYTVCEDTSKRSCDLTSCDFHYFGCYMLRVRANVNGHHSKWAVKEFCPDPDAAVGPPSALDFFSAGSDLDVFISDPVTTTNRSIKDHIPNMYYQILYWECCHYTQALSLNTSANEVTLSYLKSWTWYCVSVQSCYDFFKKRSNFTMPYCIQTKGTPSWWQIVFNFLGSLMISACSMLSLLYGFFRIFKCLSATCYTNNRLTLQFKEYFCDSLGSDVPNLLTLNSESELFDNVFICPERFIKNHNNPKEIFLKKQVAIHIPGPLGEE